MKYANIATVMVNRRNELHLSFNNDADLREAYDEITREFLLDKMLVASFARRCAVEQELIDMAKGKRPLPTAEKLWELALKLGTPTNPTW